MPAGRDLIFFDDASEWEAIVNLTRIAQTLPGDRFVPIGSFDLGVELNEEYIAVVAGTTQGRSNWFFAGDITQVYNFTPGGSNPVLGQIKPQRTRLAINRLQLVETSRVSTDSFDLRYSPPYWFKDCAIRVYRYTGDVKNFVKDSLFEIGNALGVDPNNPSGRIVEALLALKLDLEAQFAELRERLNQDNEAADSEFAQLVERISQIDAGIYTAVEAVGELLPPNTADSYRLTAQQRLDLDLGFL